MLYYDRICLSFHFLLYLIRYLFNFEACFLTLVYVLTGEARVGDLVIFTGEASITFDNFFLEMRKVGDVYNQLDSMKVLNSLSIANLVLRLSSMDTTIVSKWKVDS